jgi:uncharacterized GH25 family protein
VFGPKKTKLDLTPNLVDSGYTPQEGYWSTQFVPDQPGLYMAVSTFDKVMSYAPVRDIKCAKTFFVASNSLDRVPAVNPGFEQLIGSPLELVPKVNPVTPFGPGNELRVQVLFQGKPRPGVPVSFVPKGAEVADGPDARFDRVSDANGIVTMTLKEANRYLVAAHLKDAAAKGEGYEAINYSATLCMIVPAICPCCS